MYATAPLLGKMNYALGGIRYFSLLSVGHHRCISVTVGKLHPITVIRTDWEVVKQNLLLVPQSFGLP